jgi:(1->4)-alpha-D-glucan 1-alpha-D-glucosylmutase
VFDFLRDTLLLAPIEGESDEDRGMRRDFVMKFQQYTGPVTAKGVEDTAFYRYNRLVSLNEVGGEPDTFGISVAAFHRQNHERAARWPAAMIATATHDTKRGEDTRARINVLSEIPRDWRSSISRWSRANRSRKLLVDGAPAPDANEEYLLYQALIGAWPAEPMDREGREQFTRRVQEYMLKAAKEAKVNTSWISANETYDGAIRAFVADVLAAGGNDRFMRDFLPLQQRVARAGMVNSLAQLLLKLMSPGVPDIYQGTEFWDLSLVDPDNRRPVDYDQREAALRDIQAIADDQRDAAARDLLASWPDGRIKMYVMHRALGLRAERPRLFRTGAYLPLDVSGARRDNICAFARTLGDDLVIAVVPRLVARLGRDSDGLPLGPVWGDTGIKLPAASRGATFRDRFTGATIEPVEADGAPALSIASLFATLPLALIESVHPPDGTNNSRSPRTG